MSRTGIFMAKWIETYAEDVYPSIRAGTLKTAPTYKRLKREYDLGLVRAFSDRDDTDGARLVSFRRDGQFVFKWVATGDK